MKRIYITLIFLLPLFVKAQDTVLVGDSILLFRHLPTLVGMTDSSREDRYTPDYHQGFIIPSSRPIYGIAYVVSSDVDSAFLARFRWSTAVWAMRGKNQPIDPILYLYAGRKYYEPYEIAQYDGCFPETDTCTLFKTRKFRYDYGDSMSSTFILKEFYFSRPLYIQDTVMFSLDKSHRTTSQRTLPYLKVAYADTVMVPWYACIDPRGCTTSWRDYNEENAQLYTREWYFWGGMFPIVGLRCSAPAAPIVGDYSDGGATVAWRDAFLNSALYQLSVGPDSLNPDANRVTDQHRFFCRLEELPSEGVWYARLRRVCRYNTRFYDTLVYSPWSEAAVVESRQGIAAAERGAAFSVSPNPARTVALLTFTRPLADGCTLTVCDISGRTLATEPLPAGATGHRLSLSALPHGLLLLRVASPTGTALRRLLVE